MPQGHRQSRRARPSARNGDGFVQDFGRLGLAPNETRVYLALLRLPSSTAAEVAEAAGVPRTKAYEALDSLERRGFCTAVTGGVTRFRPILPSSALETWVNHRSREREMLNEQEEALAAELARQLSANAVAPETPSAAFAEAVSGRARTSESVERLVDSARQRLLIVHQPPYLQPPARWNRSELAALRRGVEVQALFSADALGDERRYRPLVEAGIEARMLGRPAMKFVLRDGVEAWIALRDPLTGQQSEGSAILRHPALVAALEQLFEREWAAADPVPTPEVGSGEADTNGRGRS